MAEQLNIFVDNKPGRLRDLTRILADAAINLRATVIADRKDFGIVKLLVNDPHKGRQVLADKGFAVALKPILAIEIDDKAGELSRLLDALSLENINMLDAYGFVIESGKRAVWCIEAENLEEASAVVKKAGYKIVNDKELYEI